MGKNKGSFGYIRHMRKKALIHALILYIIAFFIFFVGKTRYSDYATMFSITAVVVCIPGSMRLVSFIMFMIHRGGDRSFFEKCSDLDEKLLIFDCVVTTTGDSYDVYAFCIADDSVAGFCPDPKKEMQKLEKHLREMFDKNSLKSVGIKIFKEEDKFLRRSSELSARKSHDEGKTDSIRTLLLNLSL